MKFKIAIATLLLIGIACFTYFFLLNTNRLFFKAVPESAIAIVEVQDWAQTIKKLDHTNYWLDFRQIETIDKMSRSIELVDSIFSRRNPNDLSKHFMASLHLTKADQVDFLLLLHRNQLDDSLERLIKKIGKQGYTIDERTYNDRPVYEIQLPETQQTFSVANAGNIVMASFNPILVEESMTSFDKVGKATLWWKGQQSETGDAVVYLNYQNFPFLSGVVLAQDNPFFSTLNQSLNWSQMSLTFEQKDILINGEQLFHDKKILPTKVAQEANRTTGKIAEIAPQNTAFLLQHSVEDFGDVLGSQRNRVEKVFKQYAQKWMDNEWAYGFTEPSKNNPASESYAILKINDKEAARAALEKLAFKTNTPPPSTQTYDKMALQYANAEPILSYLFGENIGRLFTKSYYTFLEDDYLVIATKVGYLKVILEQYVQKHNLANDEYYKNYAAQNYLGGVTIYCQPYYLRQLFKTNAAKVLQKDFDDRFNYVQRIQPILVNMRQSGGAYQLKGSIGYQKQRKTPLIPIWNTQLSATPIIPPQIVTSPITKEKHIFVQDAKGILYSLAHSGEILWTYPLSSTIVGDIQLLDYYNNGKHFFLFNTSNKVYLLNKQGKDAYNYPIRLSAFANSGLTLAHFEGERGTCFFIPCDNNNIYGYQYDGLPLEGWNPKTGLSSVHLPLSYLPYKGVHYVVAATQKGDLHFLDYYGDVAHTTKMGSRLVNAPQIDKRADELKLMLTCKNGNTVIVNGEGDIWKKKYVNMSTTSDYTTANVIGSATQENIFLSNNKIYVFNDKERLFDYPFPEDVRPTNLFTVFDHQMNHARIGAFCSKSSVAILLDNYGKFHPNFPIASSTPFVMEDLFDAGENILVTGGLDNNLVAYRVH